MKPILVRAAHGLIQLGAGGKETVPLSSGEALQLVVLLTEAVLDSACGRETARLLEVKDAAGALR